MTGANPQSQFGTGMPGMGMPGAMPGQVQMGAGQFGTGMPGMGMPGMQQPMMGMGMQQPMGGMGMPGTGFQGGMAGPQQNFNNF